MVQPCATHAREMHRRHGVICAILGIANLRLRRFFPTEHKISDSIMTCLKWFNHGSLVIHVYIHRLSFRIRDARILGVENFYFAHSKIL